MNDAGSLALGELLGRGRWRDQARDFGGLFVLEADSVIFQVVSFKLAGKRVLKMAPLYHHCEQPQIVIGSGSSRSCSPLPVCPPSSCGDGRWP
jgi:UDP-N-acetylmuramyl pentapeptide phosphotransferase/UDP-N-acetylglucosamine-1-phosphate transferase